MRTRLTHVPISLADHVPGFIASRREVLASTVLVRTRNCSTLSIIKALYAVRDSPLRAAEYHRRSQIRLKRSFLSYVDVCLRNGFIKRSTSGSHTTYAITPRGVRLLEMFVHKSN